MPRKRSSSPEQTSLSAGSGAGRRFQTARPDDAEDLPYAVELWSLDHSGVERILARASSATLAYAIFAAAETEHLGRRITLRHEDEVVAARN